jgi:6-phosphofructokinase 2
MASRILTLTLNPSVDVSTATEKVVPEHKLRCTTARVDAGGGGINVSRVVHELGALTLAIFPKGGNTGALLAEKLAERGVPLAPVESRAQTRMCFNISESSTGQEFRLVLPGVPMQPEELAACQERVEAQLPDADVLVASGSLPEGVPEDIYARLAERVRARGGKVVLDTSGPALRLALGTGLYLVKPSRREFSELVGEKLPDVRSLAAACRKVHRAGAAEIIVVSMGGEGAVLTSSSGQWLAVPPTVEARSAVGAGDSFVAAMTLSLLRGEAHDVALAWGTAAGAAALLTPGTGLCIRRDVERLRSQVKVDRIE